MSTTTEDIKSRHTWLCAEIERHNQLYYGEANPEIGDDEFQSLMDELEELETQWPELVNLDSPTKKVGGTPISGFETVKHEFPMLSIDNTYNEEELRAFNARVIKSLGGELPTYVVELKIDGVSVSLRYEKGILIRAMSRGDGCFGDNITDNVKTIQSVPTRLSGSTPDLLVIRGEIYMTNAEFGRLNAIREKSGEPLLANPRNTTAGALKTLDPQEAAKRNLEIACYDIAPIEGSNLTTHIDTLERLKLYGLPANPFFKRCSNIDEVVEICSEWNERRRTLGFEIDGLVIKVDSAEHRRKLGSTTKAPRWVIAYKYPAEIAITRLTSITVQVGRTGALTPVANLEPINLAGSTIRRASLHNFDYLIEKDIREGDFVRIHKAGEIIPQVLGPIIEKRTKESNPVNPPTECPSCGSVVLKDPDQKSLRCLNKTCSAQLKQHIQHFASKKAMDIDGLGESIVEQLVDEKIINSILDLYKLDVSALESLSRMGHKSAKKLICSIDASRSKPLNKLLVGLGIRYVGENTANILANYYKTIYKIMDADEVELQNIPEVGKVVARSIIEFFDIPENRQLIHDLDKIGLIAKYTTIESEHQPLAGKSIVVTGSLENYTRDSIKDKIVKLGGRPSTSISTKTDFLLIGKETEQKPGKKFQDALKYNVTIITEDEFENLIREQS